MYIEASRPRKTGDNVKLSRMVTLSGKSCLKFYYHMNGEHMGALKVKLSDEVIFKKSRSQGNEWHVKQIRLKGTGTKEVSTFKFHKCFVVKCTWDDMKFCVIIYLLYSIPHSSL